MTVLTQAELLCKDWAEACLRGLLASCQPSLASISHSQGRTAKQDWIPGLRSLSGPLLFCCRNHARNDHHRGLHRPGFAHQKGALFDTKPKCGANCGQILRPNSVFHLPMSEQDAS